LGDINVDENRVDPFLQQGACHAGPVFDVEIGDDNLAAFLGKETMLSPNPDPPPVTIATWPPKRAMFFMVFCKQNAVTLSAEADADVFQLGKVEDSIF